MKLNDFMLRFPEERRSNYFAFGSSYKRKRIPCFLKVLLSACLLTINLGHNEGGDIIYNKLLAIQLRNPFSRHFLQSEIVRMPANI